MLQKSKAIVLHTIKHGESGMIVYCYSECCGRIAFIVSGARKQNPKFPSALFQPLSVVEVVFYFKGQGTLCRIKEITSLTGYNSLSENVGKSCIALFLAEVLYRTLHEELCNQDLFDFLVRSVERLDQLENGFSNFHIFFMLHYSGFLGIYPEGVIPGNSPDIDNKDIISFSGLDERLLNALVNMLVKEDYVMVNIKLTNKDRNILIDCIIKYYNLHLDGILN
jgi:DNA repair protein RecO (recombination protein O)